MVRLGRQQYSFQLNHKLFLLYLVSFILFLSGCSVQNSSPKAVKGVLDFTCSQLNNEVIELNGDWEFYWNKLLNPQQVKKISAENHDYIGVPGTWNNMKIGDEILASDGFATYRLVFITENSKKLGLKIPRIFTSYMLWVNGEMLASAGKVGISAKVSAPQYLPQVALFDAKKGANEIVVQVSNFYHRSGGILESIQLGTAKQVLDLRYKNIAYEMFLAASLMVMGIYHLTIFFFRKKNIPPLYFGIFCLLVAARTLLVGENFFIYIFPDFSWEFAHKVQTLCYYLGVVLVSIYFQSVFPHYFHKNIIKIIFWIGLTFGIFVLITPARVFSVFNPIFQIFTVAIIAYILVCFFKIFLKREKGALLIIIGALILFVTSLNDAAFLSIWRNDNDLPFLKTLITAGNLSSLGQLFFVILQSLLLARKFSDTLKHEEEITAELKAVNLNLDELVKQRTKALEETNKKIEQQKIDLEKTNKALNLLSLKDPLTGLWNRRHYNEIMNSEWRRSKLHKTPVALMILDIDHFKEYNDFYGHNAGDECLIYIAHTIRNFFQQSNCLTVRYGGEEFVVILSGMILDEAIKMAASLLIRIEELGIPHMNSPLLKRITVSIGVASLVPPKGSSPKELFVLADKALYNAKAAGRNQVGFTTEQQ